LEDRPGEPKVDVEAEVEAEEVKAVVVAAERVTDRESEAHRLKAALVEQLASEFARASGLVLTEYRGLKVKELEDLRRRLAGVGASYRVCKNTLLARALPPEVADSLRTKLSGPTAVAFVGEDAIGVAKVLREFARNAPALVIKGGVVEGEVLDGPEVERLADTPPREVILSRLASDLRLPAQRLLWALSAGARRLAADLAALAESRSASGG
jgi:large subunit ribosomal protein L10